VTYCTRLSSHWKNSGLIVSADSFGADAWIDFHGQQTKAISLDDHNSWIISDRSYNKPVVNLEQCYEAETGYGCTNDKEYRQAGWAILTGGGFFTYGHVNIISATEPADWSKLYSQGAAEMGYIKVFWSEIEWWKMTPENSLATSGTAYCLANPGYEYIAYLPSGGSVTINLSATIGTLEAEWYDPKSGTYYDERTVTGGANDAFTPPFRGDAVLHISTDTFPPRTTSVITLAPNDAGWNNVTPVMVTFFFVLTAVLVFGVTILFVLRHWKRDHGRR